MKKPKDQLASRIPEATEILTVAETVTRLESQSEADQVGQIFKIAHETLKEVEADLKTITEPLNQALKAARAVADKSIRPLKAAKEHARALLSDWEGRQRAELEAAQARLRAAVDQGGATGQELVALATEAQPAPKQEGVSYRWEYSFEVVDPNVLPKDYWVIDERALANLARVTKGEAEVPGVVFTKAKKAVAR